MEKRIVLRAPADDEVDNYGVYECLQSNRKSKVKSYGLLNSNNFIFQSGIADHYAANREIEKEIGRGNFILVVNKKNEELMEFDIRRRGHSEHTPSEFEWHVIRKTLEEAKRYSDEGYDVEVTIPAEASATEEEERTKDVDNAIESVDEKQRGKNSIIVL